VNRRHRLISTSIGVGAGLLAAKVVGNLLRTNPSPNTVRLPAGGSEVPIITISNASFDMKDASRVLSDLRAAEGKSVLMVLHTLGSGILPAVQIARAVRRHGRVTAFVPYHAMSGGTLVAVAAQKIYMWPDASLGPVDPQLGMFSASSLLQVLKAKPIGAVDDYSIAMAHEAQKAVKQTEGLIREFVETEAAVTRLVAGVTTHSYPIAFDEAKALGLQVEVAEVSASSEAIVQRTIPRGESGKECQCHYEVR